MPYVETVEDLAETLADWCGVYGSCKSNGETGCELEESKPDCCRMGFVDVMQKRIRESVENEKMLRGEVI